MAVWPAYDRAAVAPVGVGSPLPLCTLIKPKKWFAPGKDGEGSRLMLTILLPLLLARAHRADQISIQTRIFH